MAEREYGQKEPMENEAMVRTLAAQASAIWPQEKELLRRIMGRPDLNVLDVGCGTGEISSRLVKELGLRSVTGIDLAESHIRLAQERYGGIDGLTFLTGDVTALPFEASKFDVALCRHMLQAVPDPIAVLREMIRVVKPEGTLYVLAEDYGMLFFHPTRFDTDEFFAVYGGKASAKANSDLRQGRKMPSVFASLQCAEIKADYVCVDTLRVGREAFTEILVHWRDGFEEWISRYSGYPLKDVRNRFNDMIECVRREDGYALWLVPCVSARVTKEAKERR